MNEKQDEIIDGVHTDQTEPTVTEEPQDDITLEEVNEDGEQSSQATIKKLREKIKALEKESRDNLTGWTRAQADYLNFKKETELKRASDIKFSSKRLINEILPTLDSFTLAKGNKEAWEKVDQNWRIGIEYIFSSLYSALQKEGLEEFGKEGDVFDPNLHESMSHVEVADKAQDGRIQSVLQKGYKLHDTILRVAKVTTGEYKQ